MGSWKVDVLLHKILGTHYQRWIPYPKGNFRDAFLTTVLVPWVCFRLLSF